MSPLVFRGDPPSDQTVQTYGAADLWLHGDRAWLRQVAAAIQRWQAHPARTVVLLPHARLLTVAQSMWLEGNPGSAVLPRFETTSSWAQRLGLADLGPTDFSHDRAVDLLTAQSLLERAGLGDPSFALAPHLVDCALQLAPLACAVRPEERAQWLKARQTALVEVMDERMQRWELAVTSVALLWVANTVWPTDILWHAQTAQSHDGLIVLQGYQEDALSAALAAAWGGRALIVPWSDPPLAQPEAVQATDFEEEAQAATACVLAHVDAGRVPVAVAAIDRMLVRRVRALLEPYGATVQDDSGWKLSTTHVAAQLIALLQAMAADASADDVLDGFKPAAWRSTEMAALEALLRRSGAGPWASWARPRADIALVKDIEALRGICTGRHAVGLWLQKTQALLEATGQWAAWQLDVAGQQLLDALHLTPASPVEWDGSLRWTLSEFLAWVRACLEGVSGLAGRGIAPADVVILPLGQLLGRPFAALVLCGCDQKHLPARPPAGAWWTPQQRAALGLPPADALQLQARRAWAWAVSQPNTTILWRRQDERGEPLGPAHSVLQLLSSDTKQAIRVQAASDGLQERKLVASPMPRPQPTAAALLPTHLSASSYDDLRRCPYRFFAMRMLGLQEVEDIDVVADTRDFGVWLHTVLRRFHETDPAADSSALGATEPSDRARLQRLAEEELAQACVVPEDFLPFEAGWPGLRDAYLAWWHQQKDAGVQVLHVEHSLERRHPSDPQLVLKGQIDRIDSLPSPNSDSADAPHAAWRVIDYKTEDPSKTQARVKDPTEDTQLAFYAALLGAEATPQGAYLSLGFPKGQDGDSPGSVVKLVQQPLLYEAREALLGGMQRDMQRLREGHALPALGEGSACEHCAARGLCRRDFWAVGSAA